MKTTKTLTILMLGLFVCQANVSDAGPIGTTFTYQGRLIDANYPADGLYDFQFKLFDADSDGNQVGPDANKPDVNVVDGYFTVGLDFGSNVFDGNAVWLALKVRPGDLNDPNVYTMLSPRQEITPTPYALQTRGIFVDDTGNVGIGTTNPYRKLHVDGNVTITGPSPVRIDMFGDEVGIDLGSSAIGGNTWSINRDGSSEDFIIQESFPYPPFSGGVFAIEAGTGNVGIGTTTPSSGYLTPLLHLQHDQHLGLVLERTSSPVGKWQIGTGGNGTGNLDIADISTGNNPRLTVDTAGNVGIGTTTPSSGYLTPLLHLQHDQHLGLVLERTNSPVGKWQIGTGGNGTGNLDIADVSTGNQPRLTIDTAGNVGIGTTSPSAGLDVNSTVKIGPNGISFSEIIELTGTTHATMAYLYIPYPSGWNQNNTRVLNGEIKKDHLYWMGLGTFFASPDGTISYYLSSSNICLQYPNFVSFKSKPYRMLLMKTN
jgi:hypothetical protein